MEKETANIVAIEDLPLTKCSTILQQEEKYLVIIRNAEQHRWTVC